MNNKKLANNSLCPLHFFLEKHNILHIAVKIEAHQGIRECQALSQASGQTADLLGQIQESNRLQAMTQLDIDSRPLKIQLEQSAVFVLRPVLKGRAILLGESKGSDGRNKTLKMFKIPKQVDSNQVAVEMECTKTIKLAEHLKDWTGELDFRVRCNDNLITCSWFSDRSQVYHAYILSTKDFSVISKVTKDEKCWYHHPVEGDCTEVLEFGGPINGVSGSDVMVCNRLVLTKGKKNKSRS